MTQESLASSHPLVQDLRRRPPTPVTILKITVSAVETFRFQSLPGPQVGIQH